MESKYKAKIRFGLSGINNVAGVALANIMSRRPYKNYVDFINKVDTSKVNRRIQKHLIEAGCFDYTGINRNRLLAGYLDIEPSGTGNETQMTLFGTDASTHYDFPKRDPPSLLEMIRMEEDAMGISASGDMASLFSEASANKMPEEVYDGQQVRSFGIVKEIKIVHTKKDGSEMAFLKIDVNTGPIETVIFPKLYAEKFKNRIVVGNGVLILARYQEERNSYLLNDIQKLEPQDRKI